MLMMQIYQFVIYIVIYIYNIVLELQSTVAVYAAYDLKRWLPLGATLTSSSLVLDERPAGATDGAP